MRQSKKPNPFSSYMALMCDLIENEPTCFEEFIQNKEWVDVMTEEYQSIINNDVWEIVPRPKNKDVVSSVEEKVWNTLLSHLHILPG
jgi:hypothetical protein